ncbi:MAG TPA: hypothetical protein VM282_08085 [Acidimicrobiales bacterium]|nr:hypothetical protein [Acidimicrobiales bacterium]
MLDLRTPRLGATESELELRIWQILRRHRVPLPERQLRVTLGGPNIRLDLAYRAERVFIEGDGFGVHSTREAVESDRTRQNKLAVAGWLPSSCAARFREAMLTGSRPGIRRLHNSVTDNPVARRPGCPHRS